MYLTILCIIAKQCNTVFGISFGSEYAIVWDCMWNIFGNMKYGQIGCGNGCGIDWNGYGDGCGKESEISSNLCAKFPALPALQALPALPSPGSSSSPRSHLNRLEKHELGKYELEKHDGHGLGELVRAGESWVLGRAWRAGRAMRTTSSLPSYSSR